MICPDCKGEMTGTGVVDTCKGYTAIYRGRETYEPVVWHKDIRCPDCNVAKRGVHHPGCNQERCPKCGGQIIVCDCDID
jgi:hypothetical protein